MLAVYKLKVTKGKLDLRTHLWLVKNSFYLLLELPQRLLTKNDPMRIILQRLRVDLFLADVTILYALKIPENLFFSGAFEGRKMASLARNGLLNIRTIRRYGNWRYQVCFRQNSISYFLFFFIIGIHSMQG